MSKIENNTTSLQAVLDAVNALPEAGSGGSGGSVETCTVTVSFTEGTDIERGALYATVVDGVITTAIQEAAGYDGANSFVLENVVCNSPITVFIDWNIVSDITVSENITLHKNNSEDWNSGWKCFIISASGDGSMRCEIAIAPE